MLTKALSIRVDVRYKAATLLSVTRQDIWAEDIPQRVDSPSGLAGGGEQICIAKAAGKKPRGTNNSNRTGADVNAESFKQDPLSRHTSAHAVVYQSPGRWSSVGKTRPPDTIDMSRDSVDAARFIAE